MKGKYFILSLIAITCLFATVNGQSANSNSESPQIDQPLKIIKKPVAEIRGTNCSESSGLTSVRVTFDKSATISKTEIVRSSGCANFDENCLRAAQKIKFKPAVKSGETITVVKLIQYNFTRY